VHIELFFEIVLETNTLFLHTVQCTDRTGGITFKKHTLQFAEERPTKVSPTTTGILCLHEDSQTQHDTSPAGSQSAHAPRKRGAVVSTALTTAALVRPEIHASAAGCFEETTSVSGVIVAAAISMISIIHTSVSMVAVHHASIGAVAKCEASIFCLPLLVTWA